MTSDKTQQFLEKGLPFLREGLRYQSEKQKSSQKGFQPPLQIIVDRAEGDFVYDLDGRKIIDFQNGWATNPLGNCHPEILEAVREAHERYGFHWEHSLRIPLAEKLASITPGGALPRFSFEVSGTEAAESAVHAALCHKKRRYVIAFASSFHGESLGAKLLSAYDSDNYRYLEAWTGGVIRTPFPHSEELPPGMSQSQYTDQCLWHLEHYIPRYVMSADNIAGVLVEPALAEGGNWVPDTRFIKEIRDICDRNDWLMIADEVLTGVGRTGTMWAVEHSSVVPDILVMGKHLSGGVESFAGFSAKDEILGDNPRASGGSTFAGTPAGCAAALKTLEVMERDKILDQAQRLSALARDITDSWPSEYDIVSEIRGLGLLFGVSFNTAHHDGVHVARSVRDEMLRLGAWAICDFQPQVRLYPALNMEERVLVEGLDMMKQAIGKVERDGPVIGDYPPMPSGNVGF